MSTHTLHDAFVVSVSASEINDAVGEAILNFYETYYLHFEKIGDDSVFIAGTNNPAPGTWRLSEAGSEIDIMQKAIHVSADIESGMFRIKNTRKQIAENYIKKTRDLFNSPLKWNKYWNPDKWHLEIKTDMSECDKTGLKDEFSVNVRENMKNKIRQISGQTDKIITLQPLIDLRHAGALFYDGKTIGSPINNYCSIRALTERPVSRLE